MEQPNFVHGKGGKGGGYGIGQVKGNLKCEREEGKTASGRQRSFFCQQ